MAAIRGIKNRFYIYFFKKSTVNTSKLYSAKYQLISSKNSQNSRGSKTPPPGFDVSIYMLGMLGLISYPPSNFNCIDIAVYNTSMIILGIMSTLVTKQYYFNYKFILIIQ